MSDVNQKLLSALKELLIDMTIAQNNMRQAALYDTKWEGCAEAIQPRVDAARKVIEEVEKEQQTKPVAQPFVWWSDASREVWMALEAGRELKHDERDAYLSSVEISGAIPLYTKQPVQTVARDVLSEDLPDAVIEATAEAIGDAYDCMRVWEAWCVGTMSKDDFYPVVDDVSRITEIAYAAILAWCNYTSTEKGTSE